MTTTDIVMGVTPTRTTIFRYGLVSGAEYALTLNHDHVIGVSVALYP